MYHPQVLKVRTTRSSALLLVTCCPWPSVEGRVCYNVLIQACTRVHSTMGLATTVFIQVHHSGTQTVPYLLNSMYFLKMFTCFTIKAGSPSDSGYTILEVYTEQCPVLLDKRSECQLARDLGCQGECLACTEDGTCSSSVQIEHIQVINLLTMHGFTWNHIRPGPSFCPI